MVAPPEEGDFFDQFDTIPAERIAREGEAPAEPWTFLGWEKSAQRELRPPGVTEVAPLPSSAAPQASPPPAPKVVDSRLILGMKNAFGGDYDKTRLWFADYGYGDLLQSNAPSQPSMFDRYWAMLGQYDRDKQQADDAQREEPRMARMNRIIEPSSRAADKGTSLDAGVLRAEQGNRENVVSCGNDCGLFTTSRVGRNANLTTRQGWSGSGRGGTR